MNEIRICRSTCMYCDENSTDATYIIKPIFNATPITEELLKMPPAGDSTIPKDYLKKDDSQMSVNEDLISRKQAIEKVKAYKVFAPTDGVEKTLNAVMDAIIRSIAELPTANTTQHTEYKVNEDE